MEYIERQFNINHLRGISEDQINEHLKLYSGYVKHTNLIDKKIKQLSENKEVSPYVVSELRRRFSFEFNGMRMHEYYFEQFEGESKEVDSNSDLAEFIKKQAGEDASLFLEEFKNSILTTRGIGWGVICYDKISDQIRMNWVDSHELGQLAGLNIILVVDMWEHAFMVDYTPSEKKKYIDSFFENLNWKVIENRFCDIMK